MRFRLTKVISLFLFFIFSIQSQKLSSNESQEIWPTEKWSYSNKESSAFDSLSTFSSRKFSLLIVKGGQVVYESYQAPYGKDDLIHVNSCTKSVISILFGMISKDEALSLNEENSVMNYFPEYKINNSRLDRVKIKHFLSMSSGLAWRGGIDAKDVVKMSQTKDWAKYALSREVESSPGQKFNYNSGGTQVIARLLHKLTDNSLNKYAHDNLFSALGVRDYKWDKNKRGVPKAGWGLHLKIEDMAKLGYLLLKNGKWENKQLLSPDWIMKTTTKKITANKNYDYGYQFWIPKFLEVKAYFFIGSYPPSKKVIAVIPKLDLVAVYVGEDYNTNKLFKKYIMPAVKKL